MFLIKQNDTLPHLECQLMDIDNNPINLELCGVRFHMNKRNGVNIINESAIIVDEISGQVKYEWNIGEVSEIGIYQGEFEINMPNGEVLTAPNDGYFLISIVKELA